MKLLGKIIASIIGLGLSDYFISGVVSDGRLETVLLAGLILGVLLFFIKPILNIITLPLRILTFNIFSLIIIGSLIWLTTIILHNNIHITDFYSLALTTIIVWVSELLISLDI
ncbi:phage holin family protein [Minisyncoccus archaeiphilus]|uniref:phage holin family protein n=1 Tax=Minisyncoccus archaeiphilus TaxID=3238481 RepID=UPI00399CD6BF